MHMMDVETNTLPEESSRVQLRELDQNVSQRVEEEKKATKKGGGSKWRRINRLGILTIDQNDEENKENLTRAGNKREWLLANEAVNGQGEASCWKKPKSQTNAKRVVEGQVEEASLEWPQLYP